ncbi:MAG TPA: ABC transporter ATP-binding protein [Dehalococcoidia bacterium]|nr:ABC transporter ATP-binding protein [Dehalococcoidia bacterium]
MQPEIILKINNIDVFHGSFQALWTVSLEIQRGEMVALVGSNTAGKSTLLDTISGLLHPVTGSIELEGRDIASLEPYKVVEMGITQVPEGRKIFPEMSVADNLIMGSYPSRARAIRAHNLDRVYSLFPILSRRKNQIAKTLSGGEQQMLVIGRGLMSNPKLMLVDEMSLGLAPIVVNEIFKTLKQVQATGITILFVEQNVRKSIQEADRAYILENGRIVLCGTSAELCQEEKVRKAYFGL